MDRMDNETYVPVGNRIHKPRAKEELSEEQKNFKNKIVEVFNINSVLEAVDESLEFENGYKRSDFNPKIFSNSNILNENSKNQENKSQEKITVDILALDTEGSEAGILESIDFDKIEIGLSKVW